jgi:DNA-binding transcriptional ArsR family regulator
MRMGETKKVSKTFIARYDILSDVIVSPVRIEILNTFSDNPTGLSYEQLVGRLPEDLRQANVRKHLDNLVKEGVAVKDENGKYTLSKLGEETYNTLTKVASKAKSEKIFANK